jgi:tRNA dimethylallyltransferase
VTDAAPPLLGIVGPTASGKTDLALAIARSLPVEILVADSRQMYRGMDVGTAKPSAAARAAVPHHLVDLVRPDEPFSVADWVARAREIVRDVEGRGKLPMIVGGTGLYVAALVDGHDYAAQPWSPDVRRRLAVELETNGLDALAERLRSADPALAVRTDLRNPRRVLRALERIEAAGGPVAPRSQPYGGRVALVGLSRPRNVLYRRIDARAHRLFTVDGLVDEVRSLLADGIGPDRPAMSGHGYAEAAAHLAGRMSVAKAIEVTARRTRQYAKRQLSWFGRDPRVMWIPAGASEANEPAIVARAEAALRAGIS